jgi:hypothetical protein
MGRVSNGRLAGVLRGQTWLVVTRSHAEVGVYAGKSLLVTAAGFMRPCEVTAVDNFSLAVTGRIVVAFLAEL